jgi:hypothetical protein
MGKVLKDSSLFENTHPSAIQTTTTNLVPGPWFFFQKYDP